MRLSLSRLLISLLLVASTSAYAQFRPLTPSEAGANEGQCVTVEGRAHIYPDQERFGTDVELGRPNEFHGFIIMGDEHMFPDLAAYEGRMVDISGVIQFFRSVPEFRMTEAHQLKLAPPSGQPRTPIKC